jgi:acylphosphatase
VWSIPSEESCHQWRAQKAYKLRGAAYSDMFSGLYGDNGTSWQVHPHEHRANFVSSIGFTIKGQVQSYRKPVQEFAAGRGLSGYVENSDEATLVGRAQGKPEDVRAFKDWAGGLHKATATFDEDTLLYHFKGFQVIHRNGQSVEDALKAALGNGNGGGGGGHAMAVGRR